MTSMRGVWLMVVVAGACAPLAIASAVHDDDPALRRMHGEFVDAFVDSRGFGRMRVTPMMARMRDAAFNAVDEHGRCVIDVELVGVARHDPPVVHAASFMGFQHPDGDPGLRASPASTRSLQPWEREALAALQAGKEIVVRNTPRGERAMGAIRARPACLSCHEDHREGDVLGALGYGLGRLAMAAQAASPSCQPERVTSP